MVRRKAASGKDKTASKKDKEQKKPESKSAIPLSGTPEIQEMADNMPEPESLPFAAHLKNISNSNLVIRGEDTPSGKRYAWGIDAIKLIEDEADYQYLKDLEFKGGSGCCGSQPQSNVNYFSEV